VYFGVFLRNRKGDGGRNSNTYGSSELIEASLESGMDRMRKTYTSGNTENASCQSLGVFVKGAREVHGTYRIGYIGTN